MKTWMKRIFLWMERCIYNYGRRAATLLSQKCMEIG